MSDNLNRLRAELAIAESNESKIRNYIEIRDVYFTANLVAQVAYDKALAAIPGAVSAKQHLDAQNVALEVYDNACATIRTEKELA